MSYQKDIEEKQGYQNVEINERNYQGWEKIRVKQKSKVDQHCDWDDQIIGGEVADWKLYQESLYVEV